MSTFRIKSLLTPLMSVSIVTAVVYWQINGWYNKPIQLREPVEIQITKGMSFKEFVKQVTASGMVKSGLVFAFVLKIKRSYRHFKAGLYRFENSVSPKEISQTITQGLTHHRLLMEFTIPEGFTLEQSIARIAKYPIKDRVNLRKLAYSAKFTKSLGISGGRNLEGYIYPVTYRFYDSLPSAEEVLERTVSEFFKRLPPDFTSKIEAKGLSLFEAVIFASLIEKETAISEEKYLVSEVIWNRLNRNIPLGIDASLIYGIKGYDGNIRTKHLKDAKNPYNSRIHKGLPPTPIGSPSISSLKAILSPSNKGYMYYVLIPNSNGQHHFSKSLKEHNKHVKKLVRAFR